MVKEKKYFFITEKSIKFVEKKLKIIERRIKRYNLKTYFIVY